MLVENNQAGRQREDSPLLRTPAEPMEEVEEPMAMEAEVDNQGNEDEPQIY